MNGMTTADLASLDEGVITTAAKGLPPRALGMTVSTFLASRPRLSEFWTPLVVLDDAALQHNVDVMARWCAERRLELMPHGKTTMAPALWQRQIDAGATGITLATLGQVRTARSFGFGSIMLANAAVDPAGLTWLASELADDSFLFTCWADSVDVVDAMERALAGVPLARPIDVCVELGGPEGRTGARGVRAAVEVAKRVAASPALRLAGVSGYEGALGHDRSPGTLAIVRDYLRDQVRLHHELGDLYPEDSPRIVTGGGSTYFDVVADVYGAAMAADERTRWVLRSGAYIAHDSGFYQRTSPLDEGAVSAFGDVGADRFHTAMWGLARVVSRPEPGLALLDGGRRDFAFDYDLPHPDTSGADLAGPWTPLVAKVSALNDQHAFVRLADPSTSLAPGDVVRLGLSHPCTNVDKWQYLPVVASADSDEVVDLVRTFF